MKSPVKSDDYAVINDDHRIVNEDEIAKFRPYIAWVLIIIGVLLVLNADSLGMNAVRHGTAPNFSWNPDEAHNAAWNVRFIGLMVFIAGLFERLSVQISRIKVK